MNANNKALMAGVRTIDDWMRARFPRAKVHSLGPVERMPRYRWTIDFGPDKAAFRLSATDGLLASPSILEQRLRDLDEGTWLSDADVKNKWVMLNLVEVVPKHPDEW
jgi:hypothetical protein